MSYLEIGGLRGYKVDREWGVGASRGWVVVYLIDGREVGRARFDDRDAADDAGSDFMFKEDGDA